MSFANFGSWRLGIYWHLVLGEFVALAGCLATGRAELRSALGHGFWHGGWAGQR